jgi:hypothetical protein
MLVELQKHLIGTAMHLLVAVSITHAAAGVAPLSAMLHTTGQ